MALINNGDGGASNIYILSQLDDVYRVKTENWFTALPYGFRFYKRNPVSGSNDFYEMFLPINPNNLAISTNFATNMIPTLYGTVEEHSPIRYYDIRIQGTTGMAPKFVEPLATGQTINSKTTVSGRTSFTIKEGLSTQFGGFAAKTLSIIDKVRDTVSDIKDSINGRNNNKIGVGVKETGYLAFHNLYRFLINYKKEASGLNGTGKTANHPLIFFNYKDNVEYKVVVQNFTLSRSADNPMLYNYSISMRGYDMRNIQVSAELDNQVENNLRNLGLNGVKGNLFLTQVKQGANSVKRVLGLSGAGINVFGR